MHPDKLHDLLWTLEGLHTVETAMKELHIQRQSAINLLSKLKKMQHATVWSGGGKKIRIYKITLRKQLPRHPGMWDILNKYNPNFQLNPWYDHQVHGKYTVEDVIVDAIQKKSFRIALASLRLFSYVKDWPRLYQNAKKHDCWQQVGALYDVSRMFFKGKKMPEKYRKEMYSFWKFIDQLHKKNFPDIADRWKVYIPFNRRDIWEVQG